MRARLRFSPSALKIITSTNYDQGFQILVSQDHDLLAADGTSIKGFDNNGGAEPTNTDPQLWVDPDVTNKGFFGYSTTNVNLSTNGDRFYHGGRNYFAKLTTTPSQLARETQYGIDSTNYLIFKLRTNFYQKADAYSNNITISMISNY